MIKIEFLVYNFSGVPFHYKKFLTEITERVIQKELKKINSLIKKVEISLILVKSKESLKLNKIWRKKKYVPEDLSFPQFSRGDLKKSQESSIILGDIFLTPELILGKDNYKKVTVHSLLHLLGYDHNTKKEEQEMQKIEQTF